MFRRTTASVIVGASTLLTILLLTGCSPAATPDAAPSVSAATQPSPSATPTATAPAATAISATATGATLEVYAQPGGSVTATLQNPQQSGAPLTLLVAAAQGDWLQVHLAQRPNGSTGWIKADAVQQHKLEYSLEASTENNTLTLLKNGQPVKTFSAATGTGNTPTPHGTFFLTELLKPTNEGYGPYAFGLSAFSDVLSSFGGGPGQIGLHGTDDVDSIGQSASHGCIRLSNADITELANLLPLGTPITID
ncbi:lipoprotein-anchoring transpeptidase ErfK/SrfK [Microbacterium testaceum]|uniref:L,D-transpeptidase family protein n=1 Tax=Microbacterium TaxID=33882 RepID=UPI001AE2E458|nr:MULTISPECIES: L,D-transpeptidase [Microbacterium]MDQ1111484.1 lipoprotein-anchoring transpeptidase ErfK/SrfK [Microbacterium testaceum]MDR6097980.1 lipoprotein-anchoring transpeptidase ErfK/SrfK [Microbacterium sp. SORGH_AS_0454]